MATENITTKYKLDISEFKAGITEANKQIKLANAEFKAATAGMDDWSKSSDGLQAKIKQLNSTLEAQKSKLAAYRGQLEASEKAYAENAKRAEELKKQLADLAAKGIEKTSAEYKQYEKQLNSVEREMTANRNAADNLRVTILNQEAAVASTEREIGNYSDELKNLDKDSEQAGEGLDKLAKRITTGVAVAITALGAAAVATGKKLWDMANETAKAGDEIDKQSQKLGVSAENYQKLSYAMERCGADVEDFRKGATNISKTLAEVQDGADEAETAIGQLGVSLKNTDGTMRSTEDVLLDTIAALADMDDETERNAAANKIFGKSYQELAPLLNSGADGIRDLMDEAEEYGMVMSNEAVAASAAFEDSLTKLSGTVNGIKNRLGAALLPSLTTLIDGFSDLAAGVAGSEQKINESIQGIVDSITKTISDFTPILLNTVGTIVNSLVTELPSLLKPIVEALPSIITEISGTIISMLPQIARLGVDLITSLADGIASALPELIPAAVAAIKGFAQELTNPDTLMKITHSAIELVKSLVKGISEAIPQLTEAAWEIISNLADYLLDPNRIIEMVTAGGEIVANLVGGIISSVPKMLEGATALIGKLIDGIVHTDWLEVGIQICKGIADAIIEAAGSIIDAGRKLGEELFNAFNPQKGASAIDTYTTAINKAAESVDNLKDRWQELSDVDRNAALENLKNEVEEASASMNEAIKSVSDGYFSFYTDTLGDTENAIMKFAEKYEGTLVKMDSMGFSFNFTGEETAEEVQSILDELIQSMKDTENETVTASGAFASLVQASGQLKTAANNIAKLNKAQIDLANNSAQVVKILTANYGSVARIPTEAARQMAGIAAQPIKMFGEGLDAATEQFDEDLTGTVENIGTATKKAFTFATKAIGEYKNLGVVKQLGQAMTEAEEEADKIASTVWSKSQETFNRQIKNDQLSISEQVAGWTQIRDQFIEGSEQWIAANDKVIESQKNLEAENKKTVETMAKDTKTAYDAMNAEVKKLQENADATVKALEDEVTKLQQSYSKAVSDRANAIMGQYGLFDAVGEQEEKSGKELTENLEKQIDSIDSFYKNIDKLSQRGVSEELVESIKSMGVKASAELAAILNMSDEELKKYNDLFTKKFNVSEQIAKSELAPLKAETEAQISELTAQIDKVKEETAQKIADAKLEFMKSVATSGADFATAFISAMSGGVQKGAKSVVTQTKNAVTKAWKEAFGGTGSINLSEVIPETASKATEEAVVASVSKAMETIIKKVNSVLNRIRKATIDGKKPFESLWPENPIPMPKLQRGGVLRRGQVGLLEGTGAEAVVPLDQNAKWIKAVADDMRQELQAANALPTGGTVTNTNENIQYTQIINAPRQPSRIELYRQTRNLLAFTKGGTVNV